MSQQSPGVPAPAGAHVTLEPGEGGLARAALTHPRGGRAEVYLHGAHATRWTTASGDEVLYLSPRARFGPRASIRGGVPVVFPQFADTGPLPKHGFARTREWEAVEIDASADHACLTLRLSDSPETRALWDHAFRATLAVALSEQLTITLSVENTGEEAIELTCALHSYLSVGDVRRASVEGLDGVRYRDKVSGGDAVQRGAVEFRGEVDRVYCDPPGELRLRDEAAGRTVIVRTSGFTDAVVWNPWTDIAAAMDDLGADQFPRFVCIEPACVCTPVRLEPGEQWEGTQILSVER